MNPVEQISFVSTSLLMTSVQWREF